jgi:hypothetical protein
LKLGERREQEREDYPQHGRRYAEVPEPEPIEREYVGRTLRHSSRDRYVVNDRRRTTRASERGRLQNQ